MKKVISMILALACLFWRLPGMANAVQTPKRTIVVAGDDNYPPFEFVTEAGVYRGFNNDIIQSISVNEELDIVLISMSWHDAMAALQQGEVDVVQGMTISEERSKIYDFTEYYIEKEQVIFVLNDNKYVSQISDLDGKRVAYQESDISMDFIQDIDAIIKVPKENQHEALLALISGEVDAFVGDRHTGMYYVQRDSIYGQIKIVGEPLQVTYYAIAVKKGDTELLEIFDQGLKNIKANGTYTKIYHKWFGETIYEEGYYLKRMFYAAGFLLVAFGGVIAFNFSVNRRLKHEVEKQTIDLKKTNEALENSRKMLEENYTLLNNIIHNITSGIVYFNEHGVILSSNTNAESILIKSRELIDMAWENLWIREYFEERILERVLGGERAAKTIKKESGGELLYIDCALTPVIAADGSPSGVLCVLTDRTEETRIKNMLYLEDKMASMGRLTTGIAHELRNPFTAIKAYVDLIPEKIDNPLFRQRIVEIVPKEIDRMNNLITALLEYARPKLAAPQAYALSELLMETGSLFVPLFREKQIDFGYDVADMQVYVDKNQIKQALTNILINSMEAISGDQGKIEIRAKVEGENAIIEIEDNGSGISEERIGKIFDLFYTDTKKNGTGMGLSVAYQMITENGGEISFSSVPGKITTARIILPVYRA